MKYKNFKELVISNVPDNPIPGQWQGKGDPRNHILGNPTTKQEKLALINRYSLLPNVPPIDDTLHLHQYAHHLNSSQIMCYNFFRPLMERLHGGMCRPKQSLMNLLVMEIDQELESQSAVCDFEYIDGSKENTNFDFYFRNSQAEVFFEIKYTEEWFAKKSSAKDPHKQYSSVYKPMIDKAKDIFVDGTINEEDFNTKYYQLARNAIRATSREKHVFFICPNKNENLVKQFQEFSRKCLTDEGRKRVRLLTWEDIVQHATDLGINVTDFKNRYLAFF